MDVVVNEARNAAVTLAIVNAFVIIYFHVLGAEVVEPSDSRIPKGTVTFTNSFPILVNKYVNNNRADVFGTCFVTDITLHASENLLPV